MPNRFRTLRGQAAPWYLVEGDPFKFDQQTLTWPGAGYVILSHIWVPSAMSINRFCFWVDTQSGNYDVGLYRGSIGALTRVWSNGGVAMPASGRQLVSVTAFAIPPGFYWSAFCVDNATAIISTTNISGSHVSPIVPQRISVNRYPLPATLSDSAVAYDKRPGPIFFNTFAPDVQ